MLSLGALANNIVFSFNNPHSKVAQLGHVCDDTDSVLLKTKKVVWDIMKDVFKMSLIQIDYRLIPERFSFFTFNKQLQTWIEENENGEHTLKIAAYLKNHFLWQKKALEIEGYTLGTFPVCITKLPLYALSLKHNELKSLPPEIGQLKKLHTLVLRGHQLNTLPPEIENFKNLNFLSLVNNNLTHLPTEISKLTKLRSVLLDGNADLANLDGCLFPSNCYVSIQDTRINPNWREEQIARRGALKGSHH